MAELGGKIGFEIACNPADQYSQTEVCFCIFLFQYFSLLYQGNHSNK